MIDYWELPSWSKLHLVFHSIKIHLSAPVHTVQCSDFCSASTLNSFQVTIFPPRANENLTTSALGSFDRGQSIFISSSTVVLRAVEVKPWHILLFCPIAPHDRKFLLVSIHPCLSLKLGLLRKDRVQGVWGKVHGGHMKNRGCRPDPPLFPTAVSSHLLTWLSRKFTRAPAGATWHTAAYIDFLVGDYRGFWSSLGKCSRDSHINMIRALRGGLADQTYFWLPHASMEHLIVRAGPGRTRSLKRYWRPLPCLFNSWPCTFEVFLEEDWNHVQPKMGAYWTWSSPNWWKYL